MTKPYYDIMVILPLEEELQQFQRIFTFVEDKTISADYMVEMSYPGSALTLICVAQDDMGKAAASRACLKTLQYCDVGLIVCVGIAGGITKDLKLGDVCYTGTVLDVYDNSKTIDKDGDNIHVLLSPIQFQTSRKTTAILNFVRTLPTLRGHYDQWKAAAAEEASRLSLSSYTGRNRRQETFEEVKSLSGCLICGSVSKSVIYNKQLQDLNRRILGIDTESGGIFEIAEISNIEAISIRGISDYADTNKSLLEEETGGAVRSLAAFNASNFLALQMLNRSFVDIMLQRRAKALHQTDLVKVELPVDTLSAMLTRIDRYLDAHLRDLSTAYKAQPQGYRLPVPRARLKSVTGSGSKKRPREVRDHLQRRKRAVLILPRIYPDKGLPCVIAQDLLTAIIGGRQAVPILVDLSGFAPPQQLLKIAPESVESVSKVEGAIPILVLSNLPTGSKSRLAHLVSQLNYDRDLKVVAVVGEREMDEVGSDFATRINADILEVEKVSFREIAFFVQRNFQVSSSQSEVIALRLDETFSKYKLSAHPSFFAGIPRDALAALLSANRRAELLQLATDGYLSFVVTDDKTSIVLSRTVRARFLRKVFFEIKVRKKTMLEIDLLEQASSFLKKFDYDISASSFVKAFFDHNILHFEKGEVRSSLAFIEAYLLSVELQDHPGEALEYFDIDQTDFDRDIFDIYAELGASDRLAAHFIEKLEQSDVQLGPLDETVILSSDLAGLFSGRTDAMQDTLDQIIDDISNDKDISQKKQVNLDIAQSVKDRLLEEQPAMSLPLVGELTPVQLAFNRIMCAAVLIGSGAEHLEAIQKRSLTRMIITLGTKVVCISTKEVQSIDFDGVEKELNSAEFQDRFKDESVTSDDVRGFVIGLFELFRRLALTVPLYIFLRTICDLAAPKVLAASIDAETPTDVLERLFSALWLSETDTRRVPSEPFLKRSSCG